MPTVPMYAHGLAVDDYGGTWAVDYTLEKVFKLDEETNEWLDTNSPVVSPSAAITAGSLGHVYTLSLPLKDLDNTIYRYVANKWIPLKDQYAFDVAVGRKSRLYKVMKNGKIYETDERDGVAKECFNGGESEKVSEQELVEKAKQAELKA